MSLIASRRSADQRTASIPQVVVGGLVSLGALLTVQMSALTAWVDTFGMPGGLARQRVDQLGRPLSGWSQLWREFGPLLWGIYAIVLLGALFWMWRAILTRQPRAGWGIVLLVVALSAVFWVLDLDRFALS